MPATFGIVVFPGSNCNHDACHAVKHVSGLDARFIRQNQHDLRGMDINLLPGDFSCGDYLRSGAIVRFSPVMQEVVEFAEKGRLVVGIRHGFQVLCESVILPGGTGRNIHLGFAIKPVHLYVENNETPFAESLKKRTTTRYSDCPWRRELLR